VVTGSARLVRSLLPTGLVDIYRLSVYPVVQGRGTRLFPDSVAAELTLLDSRTFSSGVTLLAYAAGKRTRTP
jgi:dihydrofolate reductase